MDRRLSWSEMNIPGTTHLDGWIWLLISSTPETPTSTEYNSTYSHVTEKHDTQSLTCLPMQHWIQPKVFIFRVSGPLGLAHIHPHTLELCLWAVLALWLPEIYFFFTAWLNSLSAGQRFMTSWSETAMGVRWILSVAPCMRHSFWTCFFLEKQRLGHAS